MLVDILKVDLTYTTIEGKGDKDIDPVLYNKLSKDFNKLRSFWSKACFLVFLSLCKDSNYKNSGAKLDRSFKSSERDVYIRHLQPHLKEIKYKAFTDGKLSWISSKIMDKLIENGEGEFSILCKLVYATGNSIILDNIDNVNLPKAKLQAIINGY